MGNYGLIEWKGEKVLHVHYLGGLGKCCVGVIRFHIYTKG
jgi:hypothetical protein